MNFYPEAEVHRKFELGKSCMTMSQNYKNRYPFKFENHALSLNTLGEFK